MHFAPEELFTITLFGKEIPITETVVVTWYIMAFLIVLAFIVRAKLRKMPESGFQNVIELCIEAINNLVVQVMGEERKGFAPYIFTVMAFLIIANSIALIGLRPPTADVNTTFALAIMTFIAVQYYGLKSRGLIGRIKDLSQPSFFMFPIHLLSELSRPLSLGFRLFGNILGGLIVVELLYELLGFFALGLPIVFHLYFDMFAAVIQSFIFVMLTMIFITESMEGEGGEHHVN